TPQPEDDVVIRNLDYNAVVDHRVGADTVQSISSPDASATLAVTGRSALNVTGAINVPTLKADTDGQVAANNIDSLDINLLAVGGGAIEFPALTSYHAKIFTNVDARGPGSLIDFPALTLLMATTGSTPPGETRLDLLADQGGVIRLPALTSVLGHPQDYL